MDQHIAATAPRSTTHTLSPIALWTAHVILWLGLILGVPAGVLPAAINWIRMGRVKKGLTFLIAVEGTFFVLLNYSPPGTELIVFIVNVATITYLHFQMRSDIAGYRQDHPVGNANWIIGCLLGLGAWLVLFAATIALQAAPGLIRALIW